MKKYIYLFLTLALLIPLSIFALNNKQNANASSNTKNEYADAIFIENNEKINSTYTEDIYSLDQEIPFVRKTDTPMLWPCSSENISQYFHAGHEGIDIAKAGEEENLIYTAEDGIVKEIKDGWNGGYGVYILIEHENGLSSHYSHLDKVFVQIDETVKRGQAIASMGDTGLSTGPHLHFEIRNTEEKLDPMDYIR